MGKSSTFVRTICIGVLASSCGRADGAEVDPELAAKVALWSRLLESHVGEPRASLWDDFGSPHSLEWGTDGEHLAFVYYPPPYTEQNPFASHVRLECCFEGDEVTCVRWASCGEPPPRGTSLETEVARREAR